MRIHTDRRGAKVAEIAAEPRVAVLAWEPRARVQLRLAGHAAVLAGGPAWQAAWDAIPPDAQRDYAQSDPPGTPCDAPPGASSHPEPARHFAVVSVTVERLDWLRLARGAHRRAGFGLSHGSPLAMWLVP